MSLFSCWKYSPGRTSESVVGAAMARCSHVVHGKGSDTPYDPNCQMKNGMWWLWGR